MVPLFAEVILNPAHGRTMRTSPWRAESVHQASGKVHALKSQEDSIPPFPASKIRVGRGTAANAALPYKPPKSLAIAGVGVGRGGAPLFDPFTHLFVGGTGGNEIAEGVRIDASAAEEALIERAIELVITIQADEGRAAFIESTRGELMPGERVVRRTRFIGAKVRGQLANSIEILIGHTFHAYRLRGRNRVEGNGGGN